MDNQQLKQEAKEYGEKHKKELYSRDRHLALAYEAGATAQGDWAYILKLETQIENLTKERNAYREALEWYAEKPESMIARAVLQNFRKEEQS